MADTRRTIKLSQRHDTMLRTLSKRIDDTMTGTIERALEALEVQQAQRDKEVGK